MEALAHGVPVMAARIGGLPDYVREGEGGILFEPDSVDGLAEALRRGIGDLSRLRKELVSPLSFTEALERFEERLTGR